LSEETVSPRRKGAGSFFGRRRGKTLRPQQETALQNRLPALILDISKSPPTDINALFARPEPHVRLEIGFGGGEHLLHRMQENPGWNFIGVEPFVNGMAKLVTALKPDTDNLRLFDQDAALLLDWLPACSIDHIDLLYPDPWPKLRQNKRRFVSAANLGRLHRVLKPGGAFCFASDIAGYVNWTLEHVRQHGGFSFNAADAEDWRIPFANWPGTRYEAKALREGRAPAYLRFTKRPARI
jgi:tRNA (guanine-N7-)-methyltransferase